MKIVKRIAAAVLIAVLICVLASCGKEESCSIDALDGTYLLDMKQYAKDNKLTYSDVSQSSSEWKFSQDGSVIITLKTGLKEAEIEENETVTNETYSIIEKIVCPLDAEWSYTVDGDNLLWNNGIVMGSIKSNKTTKSGTKIKLDTPNGSSKTLEGTLAEDGITFKIDTAENGMSSAYTISGDVLTADKGVVLGTIEDKSINGDRVELKVTAPDGNEVTYVGEYQPQIKIGKISYGFDYTDDTLTLINGTSRIVLRKQK